MSDFYGYNSFEGLNDYSWVGKDADVISKVAGQMPELIQLNKSIKTNTAHNQELYNSVNQWIDNIDPGVLSGIGTSMGLKNMSPDEIKQQIKQRVPKPTEYKDTTSNEEYTKEIMNGIGTQMVNGLIPNVHTIGDLLKNVPSGQMQSAIRETPMGQQMVANDNYNLEQRRRVGYTDNKGQQVPGEIQNTADVQEKTRIAQQAARGAAVNDVVDTVLSSNLKDAVDALTKFNKVNKEYGIAHPSMGLTPDESATAIAQIRQAISDRENERLRQAQLDAEKMAELRAGRDKQNPVISPEQPMRDSNTADAKTISAAQKVTTDANKKGAILTGDQEGLKNAQLNSDEQALISKYYSQGGDFTAQGLANAQQKAQAEVHQRIWQNEGPSVTKLITDVNSGKTVHIKPEDIKTAAAQGRVFTQDQLKSDDRIKQAYNYAKMMGYGGFVKISSDGKKLEYTNSAKATQPPAPSPTKDYVMIAKAKQGLRDPNASDTAKQNAKNYLISVGENPDE